MATETRITLQMGLIASGVAALIVLIGGAIWNQQGRLVVLETNYNHLCASLSALTLGQEKTNATLQEIRLDQIRNKNTTDVNSARANKKLDEIRR
jgi:hypothetical protein